MLRRTHETLDGMRSKALYSPCETYRYFLGRRWDAGRELLFVMLNPSRATELANDPTIARCESRARRLGYGAVGIANLFAYRSPDPGALKRADDPMGADGNSALEGAVARADDILCAWGVHGTHLGREREVKAMLARAGRPVFVLGTTKDGHPRHPLYVRSDAPLCSWSLNQRG